MTQEKQKRHYTRKLKAYIVTDRDGNERLVRAYTSADALRHVTPTFHVAQADQDDIISLMASGATVETVGLPEAVPAEAAAERAKLERQREEARLEREQMRLDLARLANLVVARERQKEEAREAARALAKQGDIVDDTFEPQPEKAPPPPAIAIVAAPPTPPAPPAPRQEDAFSAPLGRLQPPRGLD